EDRARVGCRGGRRARERPRSGSERTMIGIRSGRVGRRFRHAGGAAAFLLLHLFAAGAVEARQRPSDDVYTRSIALNLSQARSARSDAARERLYRLALEAAREGMEKSPGNPRVWFLAG